MPLQPSGIVMWAGIFTWSVGCWRMLDILLMLLGCTFVCLFWLAMWSDGGIYKHFPVPGNVSSIIQSGPEWSLTLSPLRWRWVSQVIHWRGDEGHLGSFSPGESFVMAALAWLFSRDLYLIKNFVYSLSFFSFFFFLWILSPCPSGHQTLNLLL